MLKINDTFNEEKKALIENLAKEVDLLPETVKILYSRGYTTKQSIIDFINPSKDQLLNPFDLKNMQEAVDRIKRAKEDGESILVFGDYDADGICSASILYSTLLSMGFDVGVVVPEREDGYGLTQGIIDNVVSDYCPALLITVDCGISCHDEVEYLKDLGIDVIITDHHEIPSVIPETIVVNCKFSDQKYGYRNLSGAGVAYKLSRALIGDEADKYLDLVSIATIADSMPLDGENRSIVSLGLDLIKSGNTRKSIKGLLNKCGIKEINSQSITFSLVPKLNAAGRMNDAHMALELVLCDDEKTISELSDKLIEYNIQRQKECDELYKEVKKKVQMCTTKKVLVIYGENFKNGLLGIVSARISEEFNVPVVVFAGKEDNIHGSSRSIADINIFECLSAVKEYILDYGGHSQAAGLTIKKENLDILAKKLEEYISCTYPETVFIRQKEVESEIDGPISMRFLRELNLLEPYGAANKKPQFVYLVKEMDARPIKEDSPHIGFGIENVECMYFNGIDDLGLLRSDLGKMVIFEPSINQFMGREYIKGYIKEVSTYEKPSGLVIDYSLDTKMRCLSRALQSYLSAAYKSYQTIGTEDAANLLREEVPSKTGTMYIISNPDTIEVFNKQLWINISLLRLGERGGRDCVILGGVPENDDISLYSRIVYLDKPFKVDKYPNINEVIVNNQIPSYNFEKFVADRTVFGEIYKQIYSLVKTRNYIDEYRLFRDIKNVTFEEYIFAVEVFKELGFIKVNSKVTLDGSTKRDLSESRIFKCILELKR